MIRPLLTLAGLIAIASTAHAQGAAAKPNRSYAPVCAKGVQTFDDIKQVPTPYDSLTIPPGEPIRVNSEAEAEAAEMEMRGRAGKIGATGVVVTTQQTDDGNGQVRMSRKIQAVYVAADSARAQKACGK